jgi:hypothetical protein
MNVAYKTKNVIITLVLQYNGKEKDVSIPLSINLGHIERIEKTEFALV